MGSERQEQAVWLLLITYCADQENSGRIVGCRQWKPGAWLPTIGVSFDEVDHACDLWTWDGDDLIVHKYSVETEEKTRTLRERGRLGGLRSGEARKKPTSTDELSAAQRSSAQNRTVQTDGQPNGQPSGSPSSAAPLEGDGPDDSPSDDDKMYPIRKFRAIAVNGMVIMDTLYEEDIETVTEECPDVDVRRVAMEILDRVDSGAIERPPYGCFDGYLAKLCRAEMAEAS